MRFGKTMVFALIFTIICLVRFLIALIKWIIPHTRCISCMGDVVGIENKIENYNNKEGLTWYKYTVMVDYQGKKYKTYLEKTVRSYESSKIEPGSQVKILYDPATTEGFLSSELRTAIFPHLISMVVGIALFCLFAYLSVQPG